MYWWCACLSVCILVDETRFQGTKILDHFPNATSQKCVYDSQIWITTKHTFNLRYCYVSFSTRHAQTHRALVGWSLGSQKYIYLFAWCNYCLWKWNQTVDGCACANSCGAHAHERLRGFSLPGYLSQCISNLFHVMLAVVAHTATEHRADTVIYECWKRHKAARSKQQMVNYECLCARVYVGLFGILRTQFSFTVSFILSLTVSQNGDLHSKINRWCIALHATLHDVMHIVIPYGLHYLKCKLHTDCILYIHHRLCTRRRGKKIQKQTNFNDTFTCWWILKSHTLHTKNGETERDEKK